MKIIYTCYWGSCLALAAALLHLNILSTSSGMKEISNIPCFGKLDRQRLGEMFFIGQDDKGQEVYIMGVGNADKIIKRTITGFCQIYELRENSINFIDVRSCYNFYISIGTFISRVGFFHKIGNWLLIFGVKKSIPKLVKIVKKCQDR